MENATMTQPGAQPGAELEAQPRGTLAIRTLAMPADANPSGDIFGGWVLSQMDIAGGIVARERARGRVATVAVTAMTFHLPVYVGDVLCAYVEIEKIGRTSITTWIEAWALRGTGGGRVRVTEGQFTFVALDENGRPRTVPAEDKP
ncbi:MAG: acyl-CoA thioesterase [Proteobacteria bacterium]|nr:acyl-CoA thioesterase [Pseudomonadota bacterium]